MENLGILYKHVVKNENFLYYRSRVHIIVLITNAENAVVKYVIDHAAISLVQKNCLVPISVLVSVESHVLLAKNVNQNFMKYSLVQKMMMAHCECFLMLELCVNYIR